MKKSKNKIYIIILLIIVIIIFIVSIYLRIVTAEKIKIQNVFNKINLETNYNQIDNEQIKYNLNEIIIRNK